MTLANYFTLLRVFLGPLFLILYTYYEYFDISLSNLPYLLLAVLALAELTDLLDGYLARKRNEVSDLGKILDPMADSIWRISVILTFTQKPVDLPLIIAFVFLYRDSMISTLRTVCGLKGIALSARTSGKIKAFVQGITAFMVLLLMIPYSQGLIEKEALHQASIWIIGVSALYTFLSGLEYFKAHKRVIASMLTPGKSDV